MSRPKLSVCFILVLGDVSGLYRSSFFNKVTIQQTDISLLQPFLLWKTNVTSKKLCAVTCLGTSCLTFLFNKQYGICQMFSINIDKQSGTQANSLELYQRRGSCEEYGYTSLQSTSKCLKLYYTPMSWMTANSTCASAGGKLFSITTSEMFDDVLNATSRKDPTFQTFYIDGNDIDSEGNWVFSDESPILFLPWSVGEPGLGRAENCLLVVGKYYHDAPCHTMEFKFICEKNLMISL